MIRNGQILPTGFDNFQTVKSRRYFSETYLGDLTLMRHMASLEDLFDERDRMQAEVKSRLLGDRNVKLLSEIPEIGRQTAIQIM